MGESAYLLQLYGEKPCGFCGADPEHQQQGKAYDPASTLVAAQAEASKVKRLLVELRLTVDQMTNERDSVKESIENLGDEMQNISQEIEAALVPRVRATANELRGVQSNYATFIRAEQLRAQIETLKSQLEKLASAPKNSEKLEFVKLTANTMADVCARIRELFIAWEVATDVTVAFDEKSADLVVSGRTRTSHGKGVRAVMCAGYVIGLMQQAIEANAGHPGFVVLDTPLNPYKEADPDDGGKLGTSVKNAFYRNLCSSSKRGQVVVFENIAPPADVQSSCNHIHFSRNSTGRYGFLPGK
jgi:gas vesicle protein